MEANINSLEKLFGIPTSFRIPQFQRPYAWSKENQWEPLWKDIRNVAERYVSDSGNVRPHFMGAIVLQQMTNNSGEPAKRLVVDGQQRLTTLQLMIRASQRVLQGRDDTVRANRLRELTANPKVYWADDSNNEPKILQANTNDQ